MSDSPLLPLVPRHIALDWLEYPERSLAERVARFEAVALFADISGFTPMTEALGKYGRAGTEELTVLLNRYFTEMISLVTSYGGSVATFGGDALTVLFRCSARNRQAVARRAVACALEWQARMSHYQAVPTIAGTFRLAMRAGLSRGPILSMSVGDPTSALQFLVAGSVLDQCAEAEHLAAQGEVVVHQSLWPYMGQVTQETVGQTFSKVVRLRQAAHPLPPAAGPAPSPDLDNQLAAYLHPALSRRLLARQTDFVNEHRRVTTLFVSFEDFDYDHDPQVAVKLQAYFSQVNRVVQTYGGFLRQIDMGDKGSKYIVLFGTPIIHENDEERALRCALELVGLPERVCRVGVNTGFVFCGLVGSPDRQEYTVMGDAVNLAARLMQAARPGQIIVNNATRRRLADRFSWQDLSAIEVKGKSEPVEISLVEGSLATSQARALAVARYSLPMVGRQAALTDLTNYLTTARQGRGHLVGISGEAGIGKTRLAAELIEVCRQQNISGLIGECQSYATNTSYLPWQAVWRRAFGLSPELDATGQIAQLESFVAGLDPDFLPRLPLLGPVLNLPIPDTDFTAGLEGQLRKNMLETFLVACLERLTRQIGPLLIVLEDLQWIDPLSSDLLEAIAVRLSYLPVLVLIVYRPPATTDRSNFASLLNRLKIRPTLSEITLTEFDQSEIRQLVELNLARLFGINNAAPSELIERLSLQAAGNPFYITELLNLFHDRRLDPTDPQVLENLELPDSLYSLVMGRIDQLSSSQQQVLKVASVIGRVLKARWLWGAYPELGAPDFIKNQLTDLTRVELILPEQVEPELEYLFRHLITQEVAYESLTFATRQNLHAQIGYFLERQENQTSASYLDLLAFHFERSRDLAKQREYFDKAGRAAQTIYANQSALDYYQRLLPLLPLSEQSSVMLRMGEIWQLTGKWPEAQAIFEQSLKNSVSQQDRLFVARSRQALGDLLNLAGSYQLALEQLNQAQPEFEALSDLDGVSRVLGSLAATFRNLGQVEAAVGYHERAIEISQRLGNLRVKATELGSLGWTYFLLGQTKAAIPCYEQSIELSRQLGLKQLEGKQLGNLATAYLTSGQLEQAQVLYQEALVISRLIEDRRSEMQHLSNLGVVYYEMHRFAQVLEYLEQSLAICRNIGDRQNESLTLGNLGILYLELGQTEAAFNRFQSALNLSREINNKREEGNILRNLGEAYLLSEQYDQAVDFLQQALLLSRELVNKHSEAHNLGLLGKTYFRLNQFETSLDYNQQSLDLFYEVNDKIYVGQKLNDLGATHLARNNFSQALAYWRIAEILLTEANSPKASESQAYIEQLKTTLPSEVFSQQWSESEEGFQTYIERFSGLSKI